MVYLTDGEKASIEEAAEALRMPMSRLIRDVALDEAETVLEEA